jgi:hypothetical protein
MTQMTVQRANKLKRERKEEDEQETTEQAEEKVFSLPRKILKNSKRKGTKTLFQNKTNS